MWPVTAGGNYHWAAVTYTTQGSVMRQDQALQPQHTGERMSVTVTTSLLLDSVP